MKEMEAKTENRYEYRKPQEKRKQMIAPDLFEFAYVPDWYGHLAELERLALPESWKFRKPSRETKNTDTPILERYIHTIFRKQVIDFNSESDPRKADSIFHLENECVCFHTGLYTPQYKGIYGYFERNNFSDSLRDWYFRGFCDELSPKLRYIEPLPQKPVYHMAQSGINFNPVDDGPYGMGRHRSRLQQPLLQKPDMWDSWRRREWCVTSCDWVMHGIMNLMSVLILPSQTEGRLLLEDVLVPEFHGIMNLNCSVLILMWRKSAQEARIFLWITTFSIPMKCHWNVATIMK